MLPENGRQGSHILKLSGGECLRHGFRAERVNLGQSRISQRGRQVMVLDHITKNDHLANPLP